MNDNKREVKDFINKNTSTHQWQGHEIKLQLLLRICLIDFCDNKFLGTTLILL